MLYLLLFCVHAHISAEPDGESPAGESRKMGARPRSSHYSNLVRSSINMELDAGDDASALTPNAARSSRGKANASAQPVRHRLPLS